METRIRLGTKLLELVQGDITQSEVDAIVNPANEHLVLGAGVAGAILRNGGPTIQAECDRLGPIAVGEAVITGGGTLPARYVIHAVGPRGGVNNAEALLGRAVVSALRVAAKHHLKSIALPAISTGVFGFPLEPCARITLQSCLVWMQGNALPERVRIVLFDWRAYRVFGEELTRIIHPPEAEDVDPPA